MSLEALVAEVKAAEKPSGRTDAVAAFMRDKEAVMGAAEMSPEDVEPYLVELSGVTGMKEHAKRIETKINALRLGLTVAEQSAAPLPSHAIHYDGEVYRVPAPYAVANGRIVKMIEEGKAINIAHREIFIARRWRSEDRDEVLDVVWRQDDGWAVESVPRGVVMDSRAALRLASKGAPIDSNSASNIVQWLALQSETLIEMPGVAVARSGWVGRDFVAGGATVLGAAPVRVMADDGASQLAAAIGQAGTWEGWCEAIRPVSHLPRVMVAIWAAVAASMLRPLGVEGGAVIHWSARSSQGKTTALRAAWSVWGDPSSAAGGIGSWDATAKWIEERAAYSCDMPVLLDETSHIPLRGQETAARLVYALASGQGRGRGTRGGSEAVSTYRTVVLSTGEAPITSWCSQEGVSARTIELHGAPCESAEQSRALLWAITDHHGHLGPRAVAWLAAADWKALRARYRARVAEWAERAAPGGIAARLAAVVALLEAAGRLCHALGVPGDPEPVLAHLWDRIHEQAREADEGVRALSIVRARLSEHFGSIIRETPTGDDRPVTLSGKAIAREVRGQVHVSTLVVEGWLHDAGLNRLAVERTLLEQGRIERSRTIIAGQKCSVWILLDDE